MDVVAKKSDQTSEVDGRIKQGESRLVLATRGLFLLVLVVSAGIFATFTYKFCVNEESDNFITQYDSFADELIVQSQRKIRQALGDLKTLSASTTALAAASSQSWPFVTIDSYENLVANTRNTSRAFIISLLPIVNDTTRTEWEEYSQTNAPRWIRESNKVLETAQVEPIPTQIYAYPKSRSLLDGTSSSGPTRRLEESRPEPLGSGPLSPIWQVSPPPPPSDPSILNYNLREKPVFRKAVKHVHYARQSVFLDVCLQSKWFGDAISANMVTDLQTTVVEPVFADKSVGSPIVAHIVGVFPWKSFFSNILPPEAAPITVVLSNTCGEAFTIRVSGPNADVLPEDTIEYEKKFISMKHSSSFADFANNKDLVELENLCVYSIATYPTSEFEEQFLSNQPWVYMVIVIGIFLLTSIVFVAYDYILARVQTKLELQSMAAKKHENLVSSLFPKAVRDQVLEEGTQRGHTSNMESFKISPPIANIYNSCTLFFGDLANFTAWSTNREPVQIFTLLEALYNEMDELARQKSIFKVETIGDCYVAVCGVPDENAAHALLMADFARCCLDVFEDTIQFLKPTLGEEISSLQMRIGLHSGSVTAGVLRGEKSRFQLFGDAMNTASRMESCGLPGQVHISDECQKEILLETCNTSVGGPSIETIPRGRLIYAKGLGTLQTYWVKHVRFNEDEVQAADAASQEARRSTRQLLPRQSLLSPTPLEDISETSFTCIDGEDDPFNLKCTPAPIPDFEA